MDTSDDYATPEIVTRVLKCFKVAEAAETKQRERETDDLKFQVPEHQWPDEVRQMRAPLAVGPGNTSGLPVPGRPMLSIATLDEPIQLVYNGYSRAHLGVNIHPLDVDANDETASVLQGLYRNIEVTSRAQLARGWAFDRAIKAGRGVYRIKTEYDPDSDVPGDQRIVIKRVLYQTTVYLDPFAQEPDWSDGEWAIAFEDIPWRKYKRLYPNASDGNASRLLSWADSTLNAYGKDHPGWIGGDSEESRTIRVAEYFWIEYDDEEITLPNAGANGGPLTLTMQKPRVQWVKVNAIEVLDEQDWPGKYIPFVPVIGRELQPFDGERRWVGMIGPAKDGARLTNYAASAAVEMAALEPKAPWLMAEGQDEGRESDWQQSNVRNWPVLKYKQRDLEGQPAPAPQRVRVDMGRMGPSLELLHMGRDFVQAATSTFDPALGKQPTAHRSGRALVALQDQTVEGTSHYLNNLSELSIPREALIVLDLIPHFYDRAGRIVRILDREDRSSMVMLNAPFTVDPNTNRPMPAQLPPGANPSMVSADKRNPVKHYDLNKGRYGVSVSIGKSYKSKLMEGNDALSQILQADPALMPIIGDLWVKYLDIPSGDEIAKRLKLMQPPQLQAAENPNQPNPLMLMQENAALKQQLADLNPDIIKAKTQVAIAESKDAITLEKTRIETESRERIAELSAKVDLTIAGQQSMMDRITAFMDFEIAKANQDHEAMEAARQRAHELGLSAQEHEHALQQGDQAHGQAMAQAEQGQDHALDQIAAQPEPESSEGE